MLSIETIERKIAALNKKIAVCERKIKDHTKAFGDWGNDCWLRAIERRKELIETYRAEIDALSERAKIVWRFRAYKSEDHYEKGEFFFEKLFDDHTKMKTFSANHSYKKKKKYPRYCSTYEQEER